MGSGASAGHHPRGDPPHDELGRFMALVDSERHEKQWLAKQYDTKCREAAQLRQELEALYQRLYDGDGAAHRRGASTSMPLVKEEDVTAPNAQREKAAKVSEDAPKSPEKQDSDRTAPAQQRLGLAGGCGVLGRPQHSGGEVSRGPERPSTIAEGNAAKPKDLGLKTVLELREPCCVAPTCVSGATGGSTEVAMDFSQSAEELLTKLDTYREQLAQVEEALEQQPDEPSLVKLKNDLTEVIVLTEDLVKYQAAAPTEAEQAAGAETAGTTGRASVVPQPTQTSRSAAKSVHTALVGRTCEAFFEQKWYNGEIKSVRRDERGQERAMVEFIGFSNQREFKVTDVRLLRPPHPAQCQPGTRCQAIFPEDGLWYDCVITEQTEKGYKITFIDYGSKAEVKFDQIRLQSTGKVGQQKRTIKEVTTPAGYKIPESMQIAKTDTEDIIEAKRRKITAIKKQQRMDKLETEHVKQQASWQKFFYKKASTRSKCGFMSGKPKDSIFKVPDALEGRVGFMNSGQEMTKFNEARKFTYQYV
eukprot:g3755.t1